MEDTLLEPLCEVETTNESNFKQEIEKIMNGEKGLSFSSLKAFLQSPKHFYRYKTDKKSTDAMQEGSIFHESILEPEVFAKKYFVLDDSGICAEIGGAKPRSTTRYKEWMDQELGRHEGQIMISQDDYNIYMAMGNYLRQCSATKNLLGNLEATEKPFSMNYEGFMINGKIDGVGPDYIIDLKKVADASFQKVKWLIRDMQYDMQGAIYSLAENKEKYYLVFIDSSCNVTVVKLCSETLQAGVAKFDGAVNEFRRCVEEDLFYSSYEFYNHGFVEI
jgi:PDDEXK-like domain of unknown function (DUF3799)